jgi:hypothetical protein
MLGAARTSAQPTMAGIARDANLGKPLQCLHVVMMDSAGRAVTHTVTDSAGEFTLEARSAGAYRVEFIVPGWEHLSGQLDTLTDADFRQREYPLAFTRMVGRDSVLGLMARLNAFEDTPERQAREAAAKQREIESGWVSAHVVPQHASLRYPNRLRERGVGGYVLAQFVVDSTGRARPETWQLIHATHADFEAARRSSLADQRWTPARSGEKPVCELVRDYTRFYLDGATAMVLVKAE